MFIPTWAVSVLGVLATIGFLVILIAIYFCYDASHGVRTSFRFKAYGILASLTEKYFKKKYVVKVQLKEPIRLSREEETVRELEGRFWKTDRGWYFVARNIFSHTRTCYNTWYGRDSDICRGKKITRAHFSHNAIQRVQLRPA